MESLSTAEASPTSPRPETVIRPPRRWVTLELRELWEYRELLYFLTKREIQIRYKQSYIGIGWAVLQPLVMTAVFALVFGQLARVESEDLPYPVFAIAGLAPWLFFANCVAGGALSVVKEAPLVTKIYFPRILIPISRVLSLLLDLGTAMLFVAGLGLVYGIDLEVTAALTVGFLMLGLTVALGVTTLLAAAYVPYRDIGVVAPLIVQIGLFATPVIYPASLVPGAWQYVYAMNPMVSVVEGVRWALFGVPGPTVATIGISIGAALLALGLGYIYFRRVERVLADII
jgi:homopolymeric O-antigen transport system permease protein